MQLEPHSLLVLFSIGVAPCMHHRTSPIFWDARKLMHAGPRQEETNAAFTLNPTDRAQHIIHSTRRT